MKIGYATTIGNFDGVHLGHAALIAKNIVKVRALKEITKVNQLTNMIEKSKKKNF